MGIHRQLARIGPDITSQGDIKLDSSIPNKRLAAIKRKAVQYKLELQEAKRLAIEVDRKKFEQDQKAQQIQQERIA